MVSILKNRNYFDLSEFVLSLLIAFFLLVDQKIVTLLIAVFCLNSIVAGVIRGFKKPHLAFYPFILLFGFYLIGLLFTENFAYGGKDIETRLSFVLLPLFYGAAKRDQPIPIIWVIWSFILGAMIYLGLSLYEAYDCSNTFQPRLCFESYKLSRWIHPTYAAIYLIMGSIFVLIEAFSETGTLVKKIAAILVTIIFYYFVYKFYSLGPWISFLGMVIVLLFAVFYYRKRLILFFVGLAVMAVAGWLAVSNLDLLESDYNAVKSELSEYFTDKDAYIEVNKYNTSSVKARLLIWNVSFEMIREHPFGAGTGDGKDVLMEYYRKNGMDAFAELKLNQHCQYLQTAGSIGIFSALFLVISLCYYLVVGFKNRNFQLIALISVFATGCLFESILERQWGILFFMFFLCLFLTDVQKPSAEEKHLTE
jgi:O-antigen ligase